MGKRRAYAPTLAPQRVSANLDRYFRMQANEPVSISALEAGAGGDCLFHSIAAILEEILFEAPCRLNPFDAHLNKSDFFHGKAFVVDKLRTIVADQLVSMQPEAFLNILISSMNHERSGGFPDQWSPTVELERAGFGFLVRGKANAVEAIGENEDGEPGDMIVQYNKGYASVPHVLQQGTVHLAQLRENIRNIWREPGNVHWGNVTDAEKLSDALRLGLVIFDSRGQRRYQGDANWIYGTSLEDARFDYWGLLYCRNNTHFQVAEATLLQTATRSCYFHVDAMPQSIRAHYNHCNNSCPIGHTVFTRAT